MAGIIYFNGDLLNSKDLIIAHGCNAQGAMGSGVAKAIRQKYPQAYNVYRGQYFMNGNMLFLGTMVPAFIYGEDNDLEKVICNCITQDFYGREGKKYVNYDAIFLSLKQTCDVAKKLGQFNVSIPKIGAGLGGGNWDEITKQIDRLTDIYDIGFNVWVPGLGK